MEPLTRLGALTLNLMSDELDTTPYAIRVLVQNVVRRAPDSPRRPTAAGPPTWALYDPPNVCKGLTT
jgi:hypothetical protein